MTAAASRRTPRRSRTEPPLAETFGRWVAGFDLARHRAAAAIVTRARMHILDALGVGLGASMMDDPFPDQLARLVGAYCSVPEATLIGRGQRAAAPLAALHNGGLIHSAEFDDTFMERTVHTEAVIVPAVLAVGEQVGASGAQLVEAWAVGTETMLRLALACDAHFALNETGYHTTSIFGTYGAAAAAAKLLRLDARATAAALGLCTSLASGTNAGWGENSGRNKSVQPGWAAFAGITAAQLAAEGVDCSPRTIDAPEIGLYASHAWRSGWTVARASAGLGRTWKLMDGTFKFHAAGAMLQATLDAARRVVDQHDLVPEEVIAVRVLVPNQYALLMRRPALFDSEREPESGYTISHSWPYAVACMLAQRQLSLPQLRLEVAQSPQLRHLVERTEFQLDDDDKTPPEEQLTAVEVVTRAGTYRAEARRHSGYEADLDRIARKFRDLAEAMPPAAVDGLIDCVTGLMTATIAELLAAVSACHTQG